MWRAPGLPPVTEPQRLRQRRRGSPSGLTGTAGAPAPATSPGRAPSRHRTRAASAGAGLRMTCPFSDRPRPAPTASRARHKRSPLPSSRRVPVHARARSPRCRHAQLPTTASVETDARACPRVVDSRAPPRPSTAGTPPSAGIGVSVDSGATAPDRRGIRGGAARNCPPCGRSQTAVDRSQEAADT
jgi:hypothetical protein